MNKWLIIAFIVGGLLVFAIVVGLIFWPQPADTEQDATDLSQTLVALQTLSAGSTAVAQLTQMVSQPVPLGSATPISVSTQDSGSLVPSPTPKPGDTPQPAVPTSQPVPAPTAVCNHAQYVADITYPDYSQILPGTPFRKTWRIKNIGSCTWASNYALVWVDGYRMQGANPQPIGVTVAPGQVADISVDLVAPVSPTGTYESYYKFQDTNGVQFGIGDTANKPIWLKIQVKGEAKVVYEMMPQAKSGAWQNTNATITYGDTTAPEKGYAFDTPAPQLENGTIENETGLVMHPQEVANGYVQGTFPAFTIQSGDHFQSVIGCQYNQVKCNMRFTLSYRTEGTLPVVIAYWDEIYEGKVNKIDVDLSKLAGKNVYLILTVTNNSDARNDIGIWLRPRVVGYR